LNDLEIEKRELTKEKKLIEDEIPALVAANSKRGLEKRNIRLVEIEMTISTLDTQIVSLKESLTLLDVQKDETEKVCRKNIADIKLEIEKLKIEETMNFAKRISNSVIGEGNTSVSTLDDLKERIIKQRQKVGVERRMIQHNIPD
jgi:hypothetical protein